MIYSNNIIDFINHILRSGKYSKFSHKKTIALRTIIGELIMSMIEENHEGTKGLVKVCFKKK